MSIEVYTDGSCDQHDNGGYGAIIKLSEDKEFQISGGAFNTTSTQMELTAVLNVINYLDTYHYGVPATIHCDYLTISENLVAGQTLDKVKISSDKDKPLWEEIFSSIDGRTHFEFKWVKSHNGHPDNERVDKLAQLARKRFLLSQKPKCFVYYNSLTKTIKETYKVEQTVSIMIKPENGKNINTHLESLGVCVEDKDLIELRAFERSLRYTIEKVNNLHNKKVIIFCNSKYIVLTLKNIKRNRYIFGEDMASMLWRDVITLLEKNDVEVYTAGRSKLDFFEMAVEEHVSNQEKVREMLLVA